MSQLTPAMKQYFDFIEQQKDAVLFFQMGDFFEMFGQQAVEVSRLLDITLTSRNKGKENELPMCGVPLKAAAGYVSKLTKLGKKVAICEQVSEAGTGKIVQREITKIVTPGTTFDETILEQNESNYLAAIVKDKSEFVLASVDVTTGVFRICTFPNQADLYEEVHRLQPSEILLAQAESSFAKASEDKEDLASQLGEQFYITNYTFPGWQDSGQLLATHFKTIGLESFGLEGKPVLQKAAANLLSYLQETQKSTLGHVQKLEHYQPGQYMMLDEATIRNLDLFYNQRTGDSKGTLIKTIDKTETAMGGRLLRWWLLHPLIEGEQIKARHQAVQVFFETTDLRTEIVEHLRKIIDLERLVGKVGTQRVNPRDLYNLKESLKKIPAIKEQLLAYKRGEAGSDSARSAGKEAELLGEIYKDLDEHKNLVKLIEKTLQEEPPVLMHEGGFIATGVSEELDELRKISSSGKQWISDLETKEKERTKINTLKIKFNKVFGYYIEVSRANSALVPDDYIRKQTLVNAERYITPELKEYEEKVLGAEDKIIALEHGLFTKLREDVYNHVQDLQKSAKALAALDVLSALAVLAVEKNYTKPQLKKDGDLSIKQGRHAVIEDIQAEPYIPNDVELKDDQSFILLTGPNMSGKSSYLRQVALLVLLAQMGSFVPAEKMEWGIVDRIFTRVGASDNLAAGRSTFMVEMQEAAYILNHATEKSLVILDELGRGTSTYDGLSLAWAITEYLHDVVKCKTLFASHYHELIEIIDDLPRAQNFSVAVAEEKDGVVFLHQVLPGGISKSYGIEVAKLAGLPQPLVLRAKDLLAKLEQHAWEQDSANRQPTLPLMPVVKPVEHPVVEKLKEIEPNQITPIQALEILEQLKNDID